MEPDTGVQASALCNKEAGEVAVEENEDVVEGQTEAAMEEKAVAEETAEVQVAAAVKQKEAAEEEVQGYWGPGVFLTVNDTPEPWSLTQRATYWAGGLYPLERGDPISISTLNVELCLD
ncbi:hypothetical protein BTVI_37676 [Pitangus sulphuratus]|nr:hypothetical protein BTVI_37676 [Pitangus sulphuratus]